MFVDMLDVISFLISNGYPDIIQKRVSGFRFIVEKTNLTGHMLDVLGFTMKYFCFKFIVLEKINLDLGFR